MLMGHFFHRAELKEGTTELKNPSRGFYPLVQYRLGEGWDPEQLDWDLKADEKLVLLVLEISAYRERSLDDNAAEEIEQVLDYFAQRGMELILRATYDCGGHALEREPAHFEMVKEHLAWIARLVSQREGEIFLFQGMLVGNWGEMHGSKFLTDKHLGELSRVLLENIPETLFLAVRCPSQLRRIRPTPFSPGREEAGRIGLFDDAIMGSATDLGTFAETVMGTETDGDLVSFSRAKDWEQPWSRKRELAFEDQLCRFVPCGGEVVLGDGYSHGLNEEQILSTLRTMHITYLNRMYDRRVLDDWCKRAISLEGAWNGKTLYDYVGAHLGYRFLVHSVKGGIPYRKRRRIRIPLTLEVENRGFANLYASATCGIVVTVEKKIIGRYRPGWDLRDVESGGSRVWKTVVSVPPEKREYCFYLEAHRKTDRKRIHFANEREDSEGVFLGSIRL